MNAKKIKILRNFCILNKLNYKYAKKVFRAMKPEEQIKELAMMKMAINFGRDQLKENKAKGEAIANLKYASRIKAYEKAKENAKAKNKN